MTTALPTRPATPPATGRSRRRWLGLFAAVTILAVSNVVSNRLWPEAYIPWNLTVAAILLITARRCGVTWADLGLSDAALRRGVLVGCVAAASIGVCYLAAAALPTTRELFMDSRAAGPLATALFAALIRIPLGTVVLEEIAFRGVLPALVGGGWWRASLVSSGLFGLWHVLPSIGLSSHNAAIGAAVGGWGQVGQVVLAVLAMFAAGMVLSAVRRWGGHLAAPMLAHVATNSFGVLIAWWMIS